MNPIIAVYFALDSFSPRRERQSFCDFREALDASFYVSHGARYRTYSASDCRAYRKRAERRHRRKWLAKQQRKRLR